MKDNTLAAVLSLLFGSGEGIAAESVAVSTLDKIKHRVSITPTIVMRSLSITTPKSSNHRNSDPIFAVMNY